MMYVPLLNLVKRIRDYLKVISATIALLHLLMRAGW